MRTFFTLAVLCFNFWAGAQTIELPGTIRIQNSEYETGHKIYVSDASVRAPFSKAATSDHQGQFALAFSGIQEGTPVRLTVSKPGLEVVNRKETEQVILGRVPRMNVVMVDPQKLAEAQARYYGIATAGITKGFEERMSALREENTSLEERLAVVGREHEGKIATLAEAMDVITMQRDQALANARELSQRLAEVDLDDASRLYVHAFQVFQRGQVDSTLAILNAEELGRQYTSARGTLDENRKSLRQLYHSYELKESVLRTGVRYRECLQVLDDMGRIQRENPEVFDDHDHCRLLLERGVVLKFSGSVDLAMKAAREAYGIGRKTFIPGDLLLAEIQDGVGVLFFEMGANDSASIWLDKALHIRESQLGSDDVEVGVTLEEIAQNEIAAGHLDTAIAFLKRAEGVLDRTLPAVDERRSFLCSTYGTAYLALGDPQAALGWTEKELNTLLAVYGPDHPQLSSTYSNMAVGLNELGREEEAQRYMDKAIDLDLHYLGPDHPSLAIDYNNLSDIHLENNEPEKALEYMHKVLENQQKNLGPDHPDLVLTYNNLAGVLRRTKDYPAALVEANKGIELADRVLEPTHSWRLVLDLNKGAILNRLGDDPGALEVYHHGLEIASRASGIDVLALASIHLSMAPIEERQGHLDQALADYAAGYATRLEQLGPQHEETSYAAYRIGLCQWKSGQLDSAWAYLEMASRIYPKGYANWYLYKVAMDQGREVEALDRLVLSTRLRETEGYDPPEDRQETFDLLKALATKLGRDDVLKEFGL